MIRRTFLRRMAYAAMAGMLGAELAWRAPKMPDPVDRLIEKGQIEFYIRSYWNTISKDRAKNLGLLDFSLVDE